MQTCLPGYRVMRFACYRPLAVSGVLPQRLSGCALCLALRSLVQTRSQEATVRRSLPGLAVPSVGMMVQPPVGEERPGSDCRSYNLIPSVARFLLDVRIVSHWYQRWMMQTTSGLVVFLFQIAALVVHSLSRREASGMRGFRLRSRRPSRKTALSVTKAKKGVKRAAGITEAARPIRAPRKVKRHAVRRAGRYRGLMQFFRLLARLR